MVLHVPRRPDTVHAARGLKALQDTLDPVGCTGYDALQVQAQQGPKFLYSSHANAVHAHVDEDVVQLLCNTRPYFLHLAQGPQIQRQEGVMGQPYKVSWEIQQVLWRTPGVLKGAHPRLGT